MPLKLGKKWGKKISTLCTNSSLYVNPPFNLTNDHKNIRINLRVKGDKSVLIKGQSIAKTHFINDYYEEDEPWMSRVLGDAIVNYSMTKTF